MLKRFGHTGKTHAETGSGMASLDGDGWMRGCHSCSHHLCSAAVSFFLLFFSFNHWYADLKQSSIWKREKKKSEYLVECECWKLLWETRRERWRKELIEGRSRFFVFFIFYFFQIYPHRSRRSVWHESVSTRARHEYGSNRGHRKIMTSEHLHPPMWPCDHMTASVHYPPPTPSPPPFFWGFFSRRLLQSPRIRSDDEILKSAWGGGGCGMGGWGNNFLF